MELKATAIAVCLVLSACQEPADTDIDTKMEVVAASPAAGPNSEPASEAPATVQPDGFKAPLPAGVVLAQPYKARMDVAVPNKDGNEGRRTEFAFLDGDARKAMEDFAAAMVTAGFASESGPLEEAGVVRQVFAKPGYGTVFARAENRTAEELKIPEAKGFLVTAWPAQPVVMQSAAVADESKR